MRKYLLYAAMFFVLACSCFNLFALFTQVVFFSNPNPSGELVDESQFSDEFKDIRDYCSQIKFNIDDISVLQFTQTFPRDYYTWRFSETGEERKYLFYENLCIMSLTKGGKLSESEVSRVARLSIEPRVEITLSFLNKWWLWLLTIVCLWKIRNIYRKPIAEKDNHKDQGLVDVTTVDDNTNIRKRKKG